MATSRTRWVLALMLGQLALLAATFPLDALGTRTWHHLASLGIELLAAGALHRRFTQDRGFLALGTLTTAALASLSGFYLLYWKAGIRVDGYQDWAVFWHVAWSWAVLVFALQHTLVNRVQVAHFFQKSLAGRGRAALHVGAYAVTAVALVVTWSPTGRAWFTNESYVPLTLWTWVLAAVPPYLGFLLFRARRRRDPEGWWSTSFTHWRARTVADLALIPLTALAIVSGLPLLFDAPFDAAGLKYATKVWHVWPSILFTVLVFVHSAQAWGAVKAHWRNRG